MKEFVLDNQELFSTDEKQFENCIYDREASQEWFTGDDNVSLENISFKPIFAEPLCVSMEVAALKKAQFPQFKASTEAFSDTMYAPEIGAYGSALMIEVKGQLIPVGIGAIKGLLSRVGIGMECYDMLRDFNPAELAEVLTRCYQASSCKRGSHSATILVEDEKVRAINSGRYAPCSSSFVFEEMKKWITKDCPKATFKNGFYSHERCSWTLDMTAYTTQLLGQFPELIRSGFTPAIEIVTSNTAMTSVSLRPTFVVGGAQFPLTQSLDTPHVAKGNAVERRKQMETRVRDNFELLFPALTQSVAEVDALRNVKLNNAYNTLLRVMARSGLQKKACLEAADQFADLFGANATAYDGFMAVVDAFNFICQENQNNKKMLFESAEALSRVIRYHWREMDLPGSFSW